VIWWWPSDLLVWQNNGVVSGVNGAFVAAPGGRVTENSIRELNESVRSSVRLEGSDAMNVPATVINESDRFGCSHQYRGLQAGPNGKDHGLGLEGEGERSDRQVSQLVIDVGEVDGSRPLPNNERLCDWAHSARSNRCRPRGSWGRALLSCFRYLRRR